MAFSFSKAAQAIVDRLFNKKESPVNDLDYDPMQKYTEVGEYQVGQKQQTPKGKDYTLVVYKDNDGTLHQALRLNNADKLFPEYVRRYDPRLKHFRAFQNKKTGERYLMLQYLDHFAKQVKSQIRTGKNSINIGLLTDTHYKDTDSIDFYGWNGLIHVREFSELENLDLLDIKAHLGDWIDGSDPGLISESELIELRDAFKSTKIPFVIVKGNHDENDKFDEHHDLKASFPENEFGKIMWPVMYAQNQLHYISKQHGVAYYDKDDLRLIFINTSDVPYVLDNHGKKKYDAKLTLALREDQIEEIIEILQTSSNKQIIFMSHGNPINRKGTSAIKYNGRSLHELLVAFNQKEKGKMHAHNVPPEFMLNNEFDFTNVKNAKIVAYFCGHRHAEDRFRINGIQYILFNCSALMGSTHALTTKYNKNWNRKIDHLNESCGYVVNVDLQKHIIQAFGYGASSAKKTFFI